VGCRTAQDIVNIRETIEAAFANVPYPGDTNITPCRCRDCRAITAFFRGTRPGDHPLDSLQKHQMALSLFSAEALQYYLPAFLLRSLDAWEETCLVPFLITQQFLPSKPGDDIPSQQHRAKRQAIFTGPQRRAIVAYLRAYSTSGGALVTHDVLRAISHLENPDQPPAG
jgi:hypothetical protein